jgi:hypothetical protein
MLHASGKPLKFECDGACAMTTGRVPNLGAWCDEQTNLADERQSSAPNLSNHNRMVGLSLPQRSILP